MGVLLLVAALACPSMGALSSQAASSSDAYQRFSKREKARYGALLIAKLSHEVGLRGSVQLVNRIRAEADSRARWRLVTVGVGGVAISVFLLVLFVVYRRREQERRRLVLDALRQAVADPYRTPGRKGFWLLLGLVAFSRVFADPCDPVCQRAETLRSQMQASQREVQKVDIQCQDLEAMAIAAVFERDQMRNASNWSDWSFAACRMMLDLELILLAVGRGDRLSVERGELSSGLERGIDKVMAEGIFTLSGFGATSKLESLSKDCVAAGVFHEEVSIRATTALRWLLELSDLAGAMSLADARTSTPRTWARPKRLTREFSEGDLVFESPELDQQRGVELKTLGLALDTALGELCVATEQQRQQFEALQSSAKKTLEEFEKASRQCERCLYPVPKPQNPSPNFR